MARRTVVTYYSDLSGVEIAEDGVGVQFSLDGDSFEIDLSAEEHDTLRRALAPFVAAAGAALTVPSITRPCKGDGAPKADGPDARTLRIWGQENGFDVPPRGRVPDLVREAYQAANDNRDVAAIGRVAAPGPPPP